MQELVIFNCDDVLVDSEAISNEVLARMLTLGCPREAPSGEDGADAPPEASPDPLRVRSIGILPPRE